MTDQQQQVTGNPLDQLREAHEVFLKVLANVRPEQMSLRTSDDEWDVRALINHVVLGNLDGICGGEPPMFDKRDARRRREPIYCIQSRRHEMTHGAEHENNPFHQGEFEWTSHARARGV